MWGRCQSGMWGWRKFPGALAVALPLRSIPCLPHQHPGLLDGPDPAPVMGRRGGPVAAVRPSVLEGQAIARGSACQPSAALAVLGHLDEAKCLKLSQCRGDVV